MSGPNVDTFDELVERVVLVAGDTAARDSLAFPIEGWLGDQVLAAIGPRLGELARSTSSYVRWMEVPAPLDQRLCVPEAVRTSVLLGAKGEVLDGFAVAFAR